MLIQSSAQYLSIWSIFVLISAGAMATAINTLAGGGSLISFPVLVGFGIPPITANATNAFSLVLGGLSGAWASTASISRLRPLLVTYMLPTILGACAGAWLLLITSQRLFDLIIPGLILAATLLLALRHLLTNDLHVRSRATSLYVAIPCLGCVAIYGGYFGAGQGILFVAVLEWLTAASLRDSNSLKNWLQCTVNIIAAAIFVAKGAVLIVPAIALSSGGLLGGYAAGVLSQKIDPMYLRGGIVVYGFFMVLSFSYRAFFH